MARTTAYTSIWLDGEKLDLAAEDEAAEESGGTDLRQALPAPKVQNRHRGPAMQ